MNLAPGRRPASPRAFGVSRDLSAPLANRSGGADLPGLVGRVEAGHDVSGAALPHVLTVFRQTSGEAWVRDRRGEEGILALYDYM